MYLIFGVLVMVIGCASLSDFDIETIISSFLSSFPLLFIFKPELLLFLSFA